MVDMYPRVFRKKNRREVLILIVSVISFFIGLIMLTEVSLGGQMAARLTAEQIMTPAGTSHKTGLRDWGTGTLSLGLW